MTTFAPPPRTFADTGLRVFPITVDLYHRMIERGDIAEGAPYELIDGMIVRKDRSKAGEDPMTIGDDHIVAVRRWGDLVAELQARGCFGQAQQPIQLPDYHEPEPDFAIMRGSSRTAPAKPGAGDLVCVVEVADSSLRYDRETKLRIYAEHAIPMYVIVNLRDRVLEVYTQPLTSAGRYGQLSTLRPTDELVIPMPEGESLRVKVAALLP